VITVIHERDVINYLPDQFESWITVVGDGGRCAVQLIWVVADLVRSSQHEEWIKSYPRNILYFNIRERKYDTTIVQNLIYKKYTY
jgi:hypothetical protein